MITAPPADATAGESIFIAMTVICVIAVYWLPVIVAYRRRLPSRSQVLVVTLLLGWTFVGWVIALVMALREYHPPVPQQPYAPPPYRWQPPRL